MYDMYEKGKFFSNKFDVHYIESKMISISYIILYSKSNILLFAFSNRSLRVQTRSSSYFTLYFDCYKLRYILFFVQLFKYSKNLISLLLFLYSLILLILILKLT